MIRSTDEFRESLKAMRRSGTPLVLVRTADPASAIKQVSEVLNSSGEVPPLMAWDFLHGVVGLNAAGREAITKVVGERADSLGPADVLATGGNLPDDAVLLFHNAQRFWESPDVLQGIWNLRDAFKCRGQMLLLLSSPGAALPPELQPHVSLLDEPLPSASATSAC